MMMEGTDQSLAMHMQCPVPEPNDIHICTHNITPKQANEPPKHKSAYYYRYYPY